MDNLSLHEIGISHHTDKAYFHQYLDFYERVLPRETIRRFLEIGVFEGASIKTWRDWLHPDTHVEGWDIQPLMHIPGCTIKQIDQLNRPLMRSTLIDGWDVILDDGGHTTAMMQTSFSVLFPHTRLYVIEDLHAPWVHGDFVIPGDTKTDELVADIANWDSHWSTEEETSYIRQNAEVVEWFKREEDGIPLSWTVVIRNKAK